MAYFFSYLLLKEKQTDNLLLSRIRCEGFLFLTGGRGGGGRAFAHARERCAIGIGGQSVWLGVAGGGFVRSYGPATLAHFRPAPTAFRVFSIVSFGRSLFSFGIYIASLLVFYFVFLFFCGKT